MRLLGDAILHHPNSEVIMIYMYYIAQGKATLNKGDDLPLKPIGKFKNDIEAKNACEKHFEKACKALANFNKPLPQKIYI